MSENENNNHAERLGKLETANVGIHESLDKFGRTLEAIQNTLNRGNKTDWMVIFTGLTVIGALYAAAIQPLQRDITRQENYAARQDKVAEKLAEAVLIADSKTQVLRDDVVDVKAIQRVNTRAIEDMETRGSASADKRLTVLEYWMANQLKMRGLEK